MSPRAPSLPPDERRAAILRAARPLLLEHGGRVTTRQVAEAAGIAEGTVFRVFATKRELMQAVIADLMDPAELCADLDVIERDQPLTSRVTAVLARLQRSIDEVSAVFSALFQMPGPDGEGLPKHSHGPEERARNEEQSRRLHQAIVRVLEPDADTLACTVDEAASLLRSLAFATAHPHIGDRRLTDANRLASLLLGGLAPEHDHGAATPAPPGPHDLSTPRRHAAPGVHHTKESPC